jgi:hypothetical protein
MPVFAGMTAKLENNITLQRSIDIILTHQAEL